jgi:hypothetical protein
MMFKPGQSSTLEKRKQGSDPKWQQSMKDFEEKSGVPRLAKESDEAYQKRVLGMQADVKARHYAQPMLDVLGMDSIMTNSAPQREEQGLMTGGGLPMGLLNPSEQARRRRMLSQVGNVSKKHSKPFA